jgi:hypothetical protein
MGFEHFMELDLVASVGTYDCRIAVVYGDAELLKYLATIARKENEVRPEMLMEIYKAYFYMM